MFEVDSVVQRLCLDHDWMHCLVNKSNIVELIVCRDFNLPISSSSSSRLCCLPERWCRTFFNAAYFRAKQQSTNEVLFLEKDYLHGLHVVLVQSFFLHLKSRPLTCMKVRDTDKKIRMGSTCSMNPFDVIIIFSFDLLLSTNFHECSTIFHAFSLLGKFSIQQVDLWFFVDRVSHFLPAENTKNKIEHKKWAKNN